MKHEYVDTHVLTEDCWEEIKHVIRSEQKLSHVSYYYWINPLKLVGIEGDRMLLEGVFNQDKEECYQYIQRKFTKIIEREVLAQTGKKYRIIYV